MRQLILASVSFLLAGLAALPAAAYCIISEDDAIRCAEIIFIGRPVRQSSIPSDPRIHRVVFRVTEMLKGERADEIAVWNETQWAERYTVRWGEPNLIAAYRRKGLLEISGCAQMELSLDTIRSALGKTHSGAGQK